MMSGAQPESAPASAYLGAVATLATMHDKSPLIGPAMSAAVGMTVQTSHVDTDQLGTFTGDIARPGNAWDTALAKARLGMTATGSKLGIASEGTFAPSPSLPFVIAATELVLFVDDERGIVVGEAVTDCTVATVVADVRPGDVIDELLVRARFGEHGLIVSPTIPSQNFIYKGIHDRHVLDRAIRECAAPSPDGHAHFETDLRAHHCPTRRPVIAAAAQRLAARLTVCCPTCATPGWGIVRVERGLPCRHCRRTVLVPSADVHGCPACPCERTEPRTGTEFADPVRCEWCNP